MTYLKLEFLGISHVKVGSKTNCLFLDNPEGQNEQHQKRYGKLLFINFEDFVKEPKNGPIQLKIDETFDCNEDYIEKMSVMSSDRMAVALSSGKVVIRHVNRYGFTFLTKYHK